MKATDVETTVPDESAALTAAACLFHGFSDPSRLAIVRHLALGDHLACLKDCGLVTSRPEGRASMWSLNHTETIMELLSAAERLLAATGDAVTLCPNFGAATLVDAS